MCECASHRPHLISRQQDTPVVTWEQDYLTTNPQLQMNTSEESTVVETTPATVQFITMTNFKALVGTKNINLRRNPKTDKLFVTDDSGTVYFATNKTDKHEELDPKLPVMWRVEDDDYANACLVNSTEDIATF